MSQLENVKDSIDWLRISIEEGDLENADAYATDIYIKMENAGKETKEALS